MQTQASLFISVEGDEICRGQDEESGLVFEAAAGRVVQKNIYQKAVRVIRT